MGDRKIEVSFVDPVRREEMMGLTGYLDMLSERSLVFCFREARIAVLAGRFLPSSRLSLSAAPFWHHT